MTAPNLYPASVASTDYADRAAILAAGFAEVGTSAQGSLSSTTTVVGVGTRSIKVTAATSAVVNINFPPVPVTAGQTYIMGAKLDRQSGASRTHRWDRVFYTDLAGTTQIATDPVQQGSTGAQATPTDLARTDSGSFVVPAGAVAFRPRFVYLATNTPAAGDSVVVTDIQVEAGATLSSEVLAPTGPTDPGPGRYMNIGGEAVEIVRLLEWDDIDPPVNEYDLIEAAAREPVSEADEAYQSGNWGAFRLVSTFSELAAGLLAGDWLRVNSFIPCPSQLLVNAGAFLILDELADVAKAYVSSGSTRSSFIRNRVIEGGPANNYKGKPIIPIHDFGIAGPGKLRARTATQTGNLIGVAGDRIVLDGFTTDTWNGGRHTVLVGDDCRARDLNWPGGLVPEGSSGSGNGGLRYMGGSRFRVVGSHCESGDDVWQVVPAGGLNAQLEPGDPFFSIDVDDVIYLRCTGRSSSGRLMVVGNQDGEDDRKARMWNNIRGVRFIEIDGYNGGSGFVVQNKSSSGEIADITAEYCTVDGSLSTVETGQGSAMFVNNVVGMGGVRRVQAIGTDFVNQKFKGLGFGPDPSRVFDTLVRGGTLGRSRYPERQNQPAAVLAGVRTRLEGVTLDTQGEPNTVGNPMVTGTGVNLDPVYV